MDDLCKTERLSATNDGIARAVELLLAGELVAFPTETVYGLGANAFDARAVAKVFEAKRRPAWDPLIVHVSDYEMLAEVAVLQGEMAARVRRLMEAFWPGPLTLLLPRSERIADGVTAGRKLVGVRMPAHPCALELIARAGVPLAAPSANLFGRTSPTLAAHVLEDLDGRIGAVLDGGPAVVGVESTVLDCAGRLDGAPLLVYRQGAITAAMIEAVAGPVEVFTGSVAGLAEDLPSPGLGLRHYAPRARLILVAGPDEMRERTGKQLALGERVGVMLPERWAATPGAVVYRWAGWKDLEGLARGVFAGLRELDAAGVAVIVCPLPPAGGIGDAIRERLEKAARR